MDDDRFGSEPIVLSPASVALLTVLVAAIAAGAVLGVWLLGRLVLWAIR